MPGITAGNVLQTDLKQGAAGQLQRLQGHREQMAKQSSFSSDRIAIDAEQNSQACAAGQTLCPEFLRPARM